MRKTGVFDLDSSAFSERDWGKDTAIYLKLVKELLESRWTAFHSALKVTTEIVNELRTLPKVNPEPPLQDEGYHIRDSDPVEPGERADVDLE